MYYGKYPDRNILHYTRIYNINEVLIFYIIIQMVIEYLYPRSLFLKKNYTTCGVWNL